MSHNNGPILNVRAIKALRGESLTIDLGRVLPGTLTAWMKKDPNSISYRSFNIIGGRYLQLTKTKASDYIDGQGEVIEAVKGKWYFDVEQILDPGKPEEVKTIFKGTIVFANDITGSAGVEVVNPLIALNTFIGLSDTPADYGTPGQALIINPAGDGLVWANSVGLKVEAFSATLGQTSYTVASNAIVDDGLNSIQINGYTWNSRTGIIAFTGGNISIDFATGVITFHYPLSADDQVIVKYN